MRSTSIVLPLLAGSVSALGDTSHAEAAFKTLQGWYDESTGLWNTCGWWNGANCMTVIGDLAAIDDDVKPSATSIFANTYTNAPGSNPGKPVVKMDVNGQPFSFYSSHPPNNDLKMASEASSGGNAEGFLDNCYDDNGWWALAWIGAYDLTNDQNYLDTAAGIFNNMTGAGPTNCSDGGIIWCALPHGYYVNAIANELYLSVAASLASRISSKKSYYQDIAEKQWNWFEHSGMINSEGTINDGLTLDCKNNGQTVWSYNQGVVLGGLVELNKLNGNASLLDSASKIATAAIANLTDENHVVHDACEPNCGPDASQFKGIFARNLQKLQLAAPNDLFKQVIDASANSIWANDRLDSNNSLSLVWSGPFVDWVNASTHSSAMDALVAQVAVD